MTNKYIVYDTTTGKILSCTTALVAEEINIPENAAILESDWPTGPAHVDLVNNILADGFIDTRTLEDVKLARKQYINLSREIANSTSFTYAGKEIAVDTIGWKDITGVNGYVAIAQTLPPNFPYAWKAMDNTYVPIPDVTTWTTFMAAMVAQGTANFIKAQTLKLAIDTATTIEEVESVIW